MRWNILRKLSIFKYNFYIRGRNPLLAAIWYYLSMDESYAPSKGYIMRVICSGKGGYGKRYDIELISDLHKIRFDHGYVNIRGSRIDVYSRNLEKAIQLRNLGHSSGFKYSKIILNNDIPKVIIESTENILIYPDEDVDKLLLDISEEIFNKNLKRIKSLFKKIEKLKY